MAQAPGKEELIRSAAILVFAQKGFHKARAEDIAEEAGVAVGTIYNYFQSKDDLLLAIFQQEFDQEMALYASLEEKGLSVPDRIRAILQAHFARLREARGLGKVLVRERFNWSGDIAGRLLELHRGMLTRIEALIQEGVNQGWVRQCDPRIVAPALFAIVESISACAMAYPEMEEGGILESAPEELAALIWKGLEKGGDA